MILIEPQGRLCNQILQSLGVQFIAKKTNMKVHNYQVIQQMLLLGFNSPYSGELIKTGVNYILTDNNVMEFLNDKFDISTGITFDGLFQKRDFLDKYTNEILENYNYVGYHTNNDLYVHVRLGDVVSLNPGFDYYDNVIRNISFDKGYISSDSPNGELVRTLIDRYNLTLINDTAVNTINFGKKCKHIVLSNGTFSWMIGFLSLNSNVYYPEMDKKWHGDIFIYDNWNKIKANLEK